MGGTSKDFKAKASMIGILNSRKHTHNIIYMAIFPLGRDDEWESQLLHGLASLPGSTAQYFVHFKSAGQWFLRMKLLASSPGPGPSLNQSIFSHVSDIQGSNNLFQYHLKLCIHAGMKTGVLCIL